MRNNPVKIHVHCSATPDHKEYDIEDIDRWHRQRGWLGCGYHVIITRKGELQNGRREDVIPASIFGENSGALAVCLIGELRFEPVQINALIVLLRYWMIRYDIQVDSIFCHNERTKKKTCPGFNGPMLRRLMSLQMRLSKLYI